MSYPASKKLEISRLVEGSHPRAKGTLAKIGVSRPTICCRYDLDHRFGEAGLNDKNYITRSDIQRRAPSR